MIFCKDILRNKDLNLSLTDSSANKKNNIRKFSEPQETLKTTRYSISKRTCFSTIANSKI